MKYPSHPYFPNRAVWLIAILAHVSVHCAETNVAVAPAVADLSAKALEHGKKQVEQMLKDRPMMQTYRAGGVDKTLQENDVIFQWALKKFAGEGLGVTLDWCPGNIDKPDEYESEHHIPMGDQRGSISLREKILSGPQKGEKHSFEELWSAAIFELINIESAREFEAIYNEALLGKVPRREWILKNARIEYQAVQKSKEFYKKTWKPWAVANGLQHHPSLWNADLPDTFEKWIALYSDENHYPWDYWGSYYDNSLVPYLREQKKIRDQK